MKCIRIAATAILALLTGCPILSGPDECLPDEPQDQCCAEFPNDQRCVDGNTTGTTGGTTYDNPTEGGSTTADPPEPVCGNKIVEKGEQCDDGNEVESDQCDSCTATLCGNGSDDNGEECDDGNPNTYDACTNVCKRARCGDGIIQEGVEQCDDGNQMDGDLCSSECQLEKLDPSPPHTPNLCGDGYCDTEQGQNSLNCNIDCPCQMYECPAEYLCQENGSCSPKGNN